MDDDFSKIQEICANLEVSQEQLLALKEHMMAEIKRGLSNETHAASSIKCWPTCVQDFPNGCKHGRFLVADLGLTYIRLSIYHLKGVDEYSVIKEHYEVPQKLRTSKSMEIFEYMAQCLQKLVKKHQIHRDPSELSVVLPFPLHHKTLSDASVTPHTGGYSFTAEEETNLGITIAEALKRQNLRVQLVALLSDATGVLIACHSRSPSCKIGVVVGTGTNASFVEKMENIQLGTEAATFQPHMVINTDWGTLGANKALEDLRTDFDRQVDNNTPNRGQRLFEKLTSGCHVAELARCIFVACAKGGFLFAGEMGNQLKAPFSFKTRHIVDILEDDLKTFENTQLMFDKLGITRPKLEECIKVLYIVECVTRRSAAFVATGIACLLEQIADAHVVVAIDGSFYRNNHVFQEFLEQCVHRLAADGRTFELRHAEDGSDRGAAILAATAMQKEFVYEKRVTNEENESQHKR